MLPCPPSAGAETCLAAPGASVWSLPCSPRPLQIGQILSLIYLFLIIVQIIVNLKNKPEAVEKVRLTGMLPFATWFVHSTVPTSWCPSCA